MIKKVVDLKLGSVQRLSVLPSVRLATNDVPDGAPHENPIDALASTIQNLPPEIRWLHAQSDPIRARASRTSFVRGPRTRAVELLLVLAGPKTFARFLVCVGSLALLAGTYLKQFRLRHAPELHASVFVGIRALRETALLDDFKAERNGPVSYLDERRSTDFAKILHLRLLDLFTTWRGVVRDSWEQLGGGRATVGLGARERQIAFLTSAHRYAYFKTWFSQIRRAFRLQEPAVFSSASLVAFAAVASDLKVEYRLHGFQRQSLIYPDFVAVRCFTQPEALHFMRRLPNSKITLKKELSVPITTERTVAVAGCYGQSVGYDDCASFISWAKEKRIRVIVRPHPLDRSRFYEQWRGDPDVQFSGTDDSFDEFLEQSRPRMVLSWYSTTLFDALRRGIVPVTVETEAWRSLDMVFPFREISLQWRNNQNLANELMSRDDERDDFLARMQKLAGLEGTRTTS